MEEANVYAFEVDRRATKDDIKAAVEKAYGVKVVKINTQVRKGGSRVASATALLPIQAGSVPWFASLMETPSSSSEFDEKGIASYGHSSL